MKRVKYTIANWKMNGLNGAVKVVNSIDRHIKKTRHKKSKVVICPPFTLLTNFINANTGIDFGGQDCHHLNEVHLLDVSVLKCLNLQDANMS